MKKCKHLLMKRVIKVNGKKYRVKVIDDTPFLVYMLQRAGFTASEISYILGIPREKVLKYLKDCQ